MSDQLFKKRKQARQKREARIRKSRSETWLFVCEGTKTEPNYLKSLLNYSNSLSKESPIKYEIGGTGKNTESLVRSVEDFFEYADEQRAKKKGLIYSKIFVLFDKDSFSKNQFNKAIELAESKGYIPIWSNECFELWFILHFHDYRADSGRQSYYDKLTELLGIKYDKADDIFELIHSPENIKKAMMFAKRLDREFIYEKSPAKKVPCTQMFVLIEEIQNVLKINLTKPINTNED